MTIAVQSSNIPDPFGPVQSVCAQQRRLLKRFDSFGHYVDGVVAGLWLPGIGGTFDSPVKKITGRRPVFLTLEVSRERLHFTGAISRLRDNKMVFSPIFSYDVSIPYSPRGSGRVLPANNLVLARRANELLNALLSYAKDVSFGDQHDLQPVTFPDIICDANGEIFEDYSPVLGFRVKNPAKTIKTVEVRRYNPTAKILARHGLETAKGCSDDQFNQIVTEFKAEFPEFDIDVSDVFRALANPDVALFAFNVSFETAIAADPQAVVSAMREEIPQKYKLDASYHDLLLAAKNPNDDVKISRFSALQLFPVETVQELPESYAGSVLAPVNWVPAGASVKPIDN